LFTILAEIGVNIVPALAGLGIVGIAIGFGAQSLVRDIISGLLILLENQYAVRDWVQIAGVDGEVEEINLRRTVVRNFDGTVHSVPNGEIRIASNFSKDWARVNMTISVAYGEDLDHVIEVINKVGEEMKGDPKWDSLMLSTPQVLRIDAFQDSGIAIRILGETKPIWQWAVMGELRKRLKKTFDEEGIEIPWPHTKVYFGGPLEQRMTKIVSSAAFNMGTGQHEANSPSSEKED
jgi:small conductance mechanosensitive channel